jgi:hypothetical protein
VPSAELVTVSKRSIRKCQPRGLFSDPRDSRSRGAPRDDGIRRSRGVGRFLAAGYDRDHAHRHHVDDRNRYRDDDHGDDHHLDDPDPDDHRAGDDRSHDDKPKRGSAAYEAAANTLDLDS